MANTEIKRTDPITGEVIGATPAPVVTAPNVIWRGDKAPPTEIHGLTLGGKAVTVTVPPTARDGFYSPHAGFLVAARNEFKWLMPSASAVATPEGEE